MKKIHIYLGIALLIIALIIILCRNCCNKSVASYFSQDDEGWLIVGDAQKQSAKPDYVDKDGNPGGYLSAKDNATGGVWYWSAPAKFLGNKSSSYGEKISFSLKQSSTDNQFDADDVILFGNEKKIVFNTPKNPDKSWTDYSVMLSEEAGWKYDNSSGGAVSKDDFIKILRDLTAIHIRGEFVTGEDTGGLDNVILYSK
jgi:hypothetical protein